MSFPPRAVLTPCIGVCTLAPSGHCDGCFRTGDEIAGWLGMTDEQRLHMIDVVLPARESRAAAASSAGDGA